MLHERPIPPFRAVREARGESLRTVASRVPCDPGALSRIERGKVGVSVRTLYRLAKALELTVLARLLKPYVKEQEL